MACDPSAPGSATEGLLWNAQGPKGQPMCVEVQEQRRGGPHVPGPSERLQSQPPGGQLGPRCGGSLSARRSCSTNAHMCSFFPLVHGAGFNFFLGAPPSSDARSIDDDQVEEPVSAPARRADDGGVIGLPLRFWRRCLTLLVLSDDGGEEIACWSTRHGGPLVVDPTTDAASLASGHPRERHLVEQVGRVQRGEVAQGELAELAELAERHDLPPNHLLPHNQCQALLTTSHSTI